MEIIFRSAYGSSKDISAYQSLDMKPEQIYIVGKVSKKQQSLANVIPPAKTVMFLFDQCLSFQALNDGYVAHLEDLKANMCRTNQVNVRVMLPKGAFRGSRSKQCQKPAKRTISFPISGTENNGNGGNSSQSTSNVQTAI